MRKSVANWLALAMGLWLFNGAVQAQSEADPERHSVSRLNTSARVLEGYNPTTIDDLELIQSRIQQVRDQILPATVAIQVGRANGSGVIIDEAGHVLTAAHVAGRPNLRATIFLPDGRTVRGTTLGLNQELDAGLIRITDSGQWPSVPLGNSGDIKAGQWCLATGHPGGYTADRPPVLRWGRVLRAEKAAILTDCTLVGGDSGGPLFNLYGEVIGIHSRIGKNLTINVHVPVDPFRLSWDRLASGEVWGLLDNESESRVDREVVSGGPWLGVVEDPESPRARVLRVAEESPADRFGIRPGDVVVRVDETEITHFKSLKREIQTHQPGEQIRVQIQRDGSLIELRVRLAHRASD